MCCELALFLAWLPSRPEEEDEAGDAAGMVAAVHVSVTGHSSLLTRVTPDGVVRMCPGGSEGFVRGGALLIETVAAATAADVEEVTALGAFDELHGAMVTSGAP